MQTQIQEPPIAKRKNESIKWGVKQSWGEVEVAYFQKGKLSWGEVANNVNL